jgi:hypothetical protein
MLVSDLGSSEYHSYYQPYISTLGNVELLSELKEGKTDFSAFIDTIPNSKKDVRYQEGKWTVAEVIQHLVDAERVFQYRALRFSRGDKTSLPGFNQDDYVPSSRTKDKTLSAIKNEFLSVRESSISLFSSLNNTELKRIGIASDAEMSVRALGFIICGHQKHHKKILQNWYL